MAAVSHLAGSHRLPPRTDPQAVLSCLGASLTADADCAEVARGAASVSFELDPRRWRKWPVALGFTPAGGRIASGEFSVRNYSQGQAIDYDVALDVKRPAAIAAAWSATVMALFGAGLIAASVAIAMIAFIAVRFAVRQGETEWIHRRIGAAAAAARLDPAPLPATPGPA